MDHERSVNERLAGRVAPFPQAGLRDVAHAYQGLATGEGPETPTSSP